MRDLLDRKTRDVRAAEAVALFCEQVKKWIGAFSTAFGGLDMLVSLVASERMRPRSAPGFAMGWDFLE